MKKTQKNQKLNLQGSNFMPPFFAHSILIGLVVMTERRKSSSWQAKEKDPIGNRRREESGGTPWSLMPPPPWTTWTRASDEGDTVTPCLVTTIRCILPFVRIIFIISQIITDWLID